jgi:type I restriction enzyme, S subunit
MPTNVKTGYQMTEVGVIPEDWDIVSLDTISKVTSGKRLPAGFFVTEKETPYPYIRVVDMLPGSLDTDGIMYVPEEAFQKIRNYRIFKEDIFISVAGTLGLVGKIPAKLDGANLTENANRISNISCEQDYLLYVLMSPVIQNYIDSIQTIGAQPKLALNRIRKFTIPLPATKSEQQAIAEALSDTDSLIESLGQLITKKRQIKQGAMQELLTGKRRLPGFSGEWLRFNFSQLGKTYGGLTGKSKVDFGVGSSLYVTFINVMNNIVIDCSKLENVNIGCFESQNIVKRGDLLFNGSSETQDEVAMCSLIDSHISNLYLNSFCFGFRLNNEYEVNGLFLTYYMRCPEGREIIKSLAQGSTRYNMSKSAFLKLEVRLPPFEEQTAIATILSDMDAEITALEQKLSKARQIKQGMMQELLTGRIRLV